MSNMRPGVDDNPADYMYLVRVNVPFGDRDKMIRVLEGLQAVQNDKMNPARTFSSARLPDGSRRPRLVVADLRLNLLVAFGLRFFLGPLGSPGRANEQPVPNFPPGGSFTPRTPVRFQMTDRVVPLYLRTMGAAGDQQWITSMLTERNGGTAPAADDVNAAFGAWL